MASEQAIRDYIVRLVKAEYGKNFFGGDAPETLQGVLQWMNIQGIARAEMRDFMAAAVGPQAAELVRALPTTGSAGNVQEMGRRFAEILASEPGELDEQITALGPEPEPSVENVSVPEARAEGTINDTADWAIDQGIFELDEASGQWRDFKGGVLDYLTGEVETDGDRLPIERYVEVNYADTYTALVETGVDREGNPLVEESFEERIARAAAASIPTAGIIGVDPSYTTPRARSSSDTYRTPLELFAESIGEDPDDLAIFPADDRAPDTVYRKDGGQGVGWVNADGTITKILPIEGSAQDTGGPTRAPGKQYGEVGTFVKEPTDQREWVGPRWTYADKAQVLAGLSPEEIALVQADLMEAGIVSLAEVRLGLVDINTKEAMEVVLDHANTAGFIEDDGWRDALAELVADPTLYSLGGGGSGLDRVFQPPDYDTVAVNVRNEFMNKLGREPTEYEMNQMAARLSDEYHNQFTAEQEAIRMAEDGGIAEEEALEIIRNSPLRDAKAAIRERFETADDLAEAALGTVRQVDPVASFQEHFREKYSSELGRNKRVSEAMGNRDNLMASIFKMKSAI